MSKILNAAMKRRDASLADGFIVRYSWFVFFFKILDIRRRPAGLHLSRMAAAFGFRGFL
jgi:hypothetical protein